MMFKKIVTIFIFGFFTFATFPLQSMQNPKNQDGAQKHQTYNYSQLALTILALEILFFMAYLTENTAVKNKLTEQFHPQQLLKNFITQYGTNFLATFFHEFGHALTAKLLNNDPINIHLGANSSTTNTTPLAQIGGISLYGLHPTKGHALLASLADKKTHLLRLFFDYLKKNNKEIKSISHDELNTIISELNQTPEMKMLDQTIPRKKSTRAAILLAGGISGIIGHHLVKLLIATIKEYKNNPNQSFGMTLAAASRQAIQPDSITIHQLVNMLVPFMVSKNAQNDAYQLYTTCLDISPETIEQISHFALPIHLGAESMLTYFESTPNTSLAYIPVLAFLNFQLRGYLKFSL